MSRGDRTAVSGILSLSMRNNYGELGVDEVKFVPQVQTFYLIKLTLPKYYKKVGATYRNPHYPGVRLCIFSWLSRCAMIWSLLFSDYGRWWQMEKECVTSAENERRTLLFDIACGQSTFTP